MLWIELHGTLKEDLDSYVNCWCGHSYANQILESLRHMIGHFTDMYSNLYQLNQTTNKKPDVVE